MLNHNLFIFLLPFFMFLQTCHANLIGFMVRTIKDPNTKDWVDAKVDLLQLSNQPTHMNWIMCTEFSDEDRYVTRLAEENLFLVLKCNGYTAEWNTNYGQFFGRLFHGDQILGGTTCKNGPIKTLDDGSLMMSSECTIQYPSW